jgi:hypothetical protein
MINFNLCNLQFQLDFFISGVKELTKRLEKVFVVFNGSSFLDSNSASIHFMVFNSTILEMEYSEKFYLSREMWRELLMAYRQFCWVRTNKPIVVNSSDPFVFTWKDDLKKSNFTMISVLVLDEVNERAHTLIWHNIIKLTSRWHLEHGGVLLHSATVAKNDSGFLFLGKSEAGKTTVTRMSYEIGKTALGDDLNVIQGQKYGFKLSAVPGLNPSPVGYSTTIPKLRCIFDLHKDKDNYLKRLMPRQIAELIFDAFMFESPLPNKLKDYEIPVAFQTIAKIAREIPGYELHFRKSPDFWKLIDEQFPD